MSVIEGLRWGGVVLTFVGALLASYAVATVPVSLAIKMGTWWGVSTIPAKFVLEQKAYSAGALLAISMAFLLQLLSLASLPDGDGRLVVVLSALISLAVLILVRSQRNNFVRFLQKDMARLKDGSGQFRDVVSITSSAEPLDSVEMIGRFYDCPRRRGEEEARYRTRLAQHVERLAT